MQVGHSSKVVQLAMQIIPEGPLRLMPPKHFVETFWDTCQHLLGRVMCIRTCVCVCERGCANVILLLVSGQCCGFTSAESCKYKYMACIEPVIIPPVHFCHSSCGVVQLAIQIRPEGAPEAMHGCWVE